MPATYYGAGSCYSFLLLNIFCLWMLDKIYWSSKKTQYINSFLLFFIRNPWIRLVSAYISLVNESKYALLEEQPCKWYSYDNYNENSFLSFDSFLQCIIKQARSKEGSRSLDDHWKPQYTFCDVCRINYTHIGHMETLGLYTAYLDTMCYRKY